MLNLFFRISGGYVLLGLLFAVYFVWKGVSKLDPTAQGAPIGFRMLIAPAAVALWPWLLKKIVSQNTSQV